MKKNFDEINIIPFIDIMLVLLAIVLMTATFISQGKIKVHIPKSDNTVRFKADELACLITINAEGKFFLNDRPISLDELSQKASHWHGDKKITLKVDSRANFQKFVDVTNVLTKHNLQNIAIVATKK